MRYVVRAPQRVLRAIGRPLGTKRAPMGILDDLDGSEPYLLRVVRRGGPESEGCAGIRSPGRVVCVDGCNRGYLTVEAEFSVLGSALLVAPIVRIDPEPPPPDLWRTVAVCIGTRPELWFSPSRKGPVAATYWDLARQICGVCPVIEDCLVDALDTPAYQDLGLRAGTLPADRQRMRACLTTN